MTSLGELIKQAGDDKLSHFKACLNRHGFETSGDLDDMDDAEYVTRAPASQLSSVQVRYFFRTYLPHKAFPMDPADAEAVIRSTQSFIELLLSKDLLKEDTGRRMIADCSMAMEHVVRGARATQALSTAAKASKAGPKALEGCFTVVDVESGSLTVVPATNWTGAFALPGDHSAHSTYSLLVPEAAAELIIPGDCVVVGCAKSGDAWSPVDGGVVFPEGGSWSEDASLRGQRGGAASASDAEGGEDEYDDGVWDRPTGHQDEDDE